MKLFTLIEGLKTAGISGDLSLDIHGIAYHSAEVRPGYLFVAIKGTHHDGHNFIAAAIQQGATAVVAEERTPEETAVTWIQVGDSREALGWISARWYDDPSQQIKVVGITGTNGKTTTT
ncbi:MAG: UDP-N-acetylmuramoyl-L-alanyl-D-glutamate--2,6-diaminopimelate ligase, partial [Deltaproteobacteria bacterium]|nr:UDP-N-acetylmuramoyl-L-alanyl-D-glutamate--2,6-diaminopimelate ligase [Deltaproteobacteria bacterium]